MNQLPRLLLLLPAAALVACAGPSPADPVGTTSGSAQPAGQLSATMDSDGDGISDAAEGSGDADGDGVPAYLDADEMGGSGVAAGGGLTAGTSGGLTAGGTGSLTTGGTATTGGTTATATTSPMLDAGMDSGGSDAATIPSGDDSANGDGVFTCNYKTVLGTVDACAEYLPADGWSAAAAKSNCEKQWMASAVMFDVEPGCDTADRCKAMDINPDQDQTGFTFYAYGSPQGICEDTLGGTFETKPGSGWPDY